MRNAWQVTAIIAIILVIVMLVPLVIVLRERQSHVTETADARRQHAEIEQRVRTLSMKWQT